MVDSPPACNEWLVSWRVTEATTRFAGQVALVTGAGSGIGQATARLFAQVGARVVVADYDEHAAEATVDDIVRQGGQAIAERVDVSRLEEVRAMVERTMAAFAALDILVNNAGIAVAGDIVATSEADLDRILAVNVKGVFFGCQAAIPRMLERGGGVIVNVTSAAALSAMPDRAAYIASRVPCWRSPGRLPWTSWPGGSVATASRQGRSSRRGWAASSPGTMTPPALASAWSSASRSGAWADRRRSLMPSCTWPRRRPTSSMAAAWLSMGFTVR